MKILAFSDWRIQKISDIFEFLVNVGESIDFILYAGDDIGRFEDEGHNYFSEMSNYTNQNQVLAIIGNDDSPNVKNVLTKKNVHDLYEKPYIYEDYAFLGLEAATSGPALLLHSEKEVAKHLKNQYRQAKKKKIIILSHAPPYGILDLGIRFAPKNERTHHIGSKSLKRFIDKVPVELVVCGHCHSQGGLTENLNGVKILNVASHDNIGSKGIFALITCDPNCISVNWHNTRELIRKNSLLRINGIGAVREKALTTMGVHTISDLANLRNIQSYSKETSFSEYFLRKLQLKANSILNNVTYQISPFNVEVQDNIFFDIETDISCEHVWLIGTLRNNEFKQFYADDLSEEKKILKKFLKYLQKYPESSLISYSGTNFDKNVVSRALKRKKLDYTLFRTIPHLDLCRLLKRSFIFPNQNFALKDIGRFFNYPFREEDLDGFFIALSYERHLRDDVKLEEYVFEYNEDDVRVLPYIIKNIVSNIHSYNREFYDSISVFENGYIDLNLNDDELRTFIKEYYENYGSLIIRPDKRCNSYNTEIRFYANDISTLRKIRSAMSQLGYTEGSPYFYKRKSRCYVPFYGQEQVIDFINDFKPSRKNDIRLLLN
ncbi:MAG: TM0106 family RecB-like putative nuclease [Candidatus Bathyarchaeia archaeon]